MIELVVEFLLQDADTQSGMVSICEYRGASEYLAFHYAIGKGHYQHEPNHRCIYPAFESIQECERNALYYGGAYIQHFMVEGDPSRTWYRFVCKPKGVA